MLSIGIDPGHGDGTGCRSACGRIVEDDWTMALARAVALAVRASGEPFEPVLLRARDGENPSLPQRNVVAEQAGCVAVVSLHVNSWRNAEQRGAMTFHWPGSSLGQRMAEAIISAFPRPLRNRGLAFIADASQWPRAHSLLGAYSMPTALVECGFASREQDVDALVEPSIQAAIVGAVMQGIRVVRIASEARHLAA